MTAAVDWTVSFDDGLCQRLDHCTLDLREGTCDETSLGGFVDNLFCRS